MSKKTINLKHPTQAIRRSPDHWVNERASESEPTKRFTVDVSIDLHRRVKIGCVERGVNMTDIVRDLLEREFPQ